MRPSVCRRFLINSLRLTEKTVLETNQMKPTALQSDLIEKFNLQNNKQFPEAAQIYMKKLNERNLERYAKEKQLQKHYKISGAVLFAVVLSVYFYTMYAINQEKFLDDFTVPEPPDPAVKQFKK